MQYEKEKQNMHKLFVSLKEQNKNVHVLNGKKTCNCNFKKMFTFKRPSTRKRKF